MEMNEVELKNIKECKAQWISKVFFVFDSIRSQYSHF